MIRTPILYASLCGVLLCLTSPSSAREVAAPKAIIAQPAQKYVVPAGIDKVMTTVTHVSYDFEDGVGGPDSQGWTSIDLTEQTGQLETYFHVDDLNGLGGGISGNLLPLAGARSLWCGARPGDPGTAGYATLPGYGSNWYQLFESIDFVRDTGDVTVTFLTRFDLEPGFDFVFLQYLSVTEDWETLTTFSGAHMSADSLHTSTIPASNLGASVRIRFKMTSDSIYDDADGLEDTDGAMLVDNLSISDSGTFSDFQDFETESVGALVTADGNWTASPKTPYGDFAGLYDGSTVLQEDPLITNNSHFWAFYSGSTADYGCSGFPLQTAVPYGVDDQYLWNAIKSPRIKLNRDENGNYVPSIGTLTMEFDVYRDLAQDGLVLYEWAVRTFVDGIAGPWLDKNFIYYGGDKDWFRHTEDITTLVDPAATHIQISLGVFDYCSVVCGVNTSAGCHSHAPLIDNVLLTRNPNQQVVTNTNDSGAGSFRQALLNANLRESLVTFNIPLGGPHVISPIGSLPAIGAKVVVDGYSQPGSSPNTNPIDQPNNANIMIVIDGSNIPQVPGISGLFLSGGNSVVRGLAVGNYGRNGIQVQSNNNSVVGCYIGIDPDGVSAMGNGNGVLVSIDDMNNRVGGPDPQDHNVITHNRGFGVFLYDNARGSVVQGNFIGLTADGQSAPGNSGSGVYVRNANTSLIGGAVASQRNVISGNSKGIFVFDTDSLIIDGNLIGTASDGSGNLGNATDGIFVSANSNVVTIGSVGVGNLITRNGRDGIRLDPSQVGQITILGNSIDLNGALAIDFDGDGVTATNAPVISAVIPSDQNALVVGTIAFSVPNVFVTIDFYESPTCDPSGFGEGARYLGSQDVFTGPSFMTFNAPVVNPTPGWYITSLTRRFSEFSNCVQLINTDVGTDVSVAVGDDGTGNPQAVLTFDDVTVAGATTIAESVNCAAFPSGFVFGDSVCWDISTDAVFADSITICLNYDESQVSGAESNLVLLHYDASLTAWVDITISVDTVANEICGRSAALSPFSLALPTWASAVGDQTGLPSRLALGQNYPNPFNPQTTIVFVLSSEQPVSLRVFDLSGRLVRALVDGEVYGQGINEVIWNGRNDKGKQVAAGVYFYRLDAGEYSETKRMALIK